MFFSHFVAGSGRWSRMCGRRKRCSSSVLAIEQLENRVCLSGDGLNPTAITDVGGAVYYVATTAPEGRELWVSDGTAAGTRLVTDVNPGLSGSFPGELTNVNGTLYFTAFNPASGTELWKSDGTAAGTEQVKDIIPGSVGSMPSSLTNVNGVLFFTAADGVGSNELWKSDGTAAGTVKIQELELGDPGSNPQSLTNFNGLLYYAAIDGIGGEALWRSDGTALGTIQVKSINSSNGTFPTSLTNVNGTLYFNANDGVTGQELWKSDGTTIGTVQVKDINPGSASSNPGSLTNVNGVLYFTALDDANPDPDKHGVELWKSDGTAAGTVLVKDINVGVSGSFPSSLRDVSGKLFFVADDGIAGRELWITDGTAAGTLIVNDIIPGPGSAFPDSPTNVNGTLYFVAGGSDGGRELWKSDGTPAGTVQVKDIFPGVTSSTPQGLTNANGTLYFSATNGAGGHELWKSDGTTAGTVSVTNYFAGTLTFSPLPSQIIAENTSTAALSLTLVDVDNGVAGLTVSATSSNVLLVPNGNIVVSGTGADRRLVVTPAADQSGVTTITVTVSDGVRSYSQSFQVTVTHVDKPAVITLAALPLNVSTSSKNAVAVDNTATISDPDTPDLVFDEAVLQVTGQAAKDTLSILKQGSLTTRGKKVLFDGEVIGMLEGGRKKTPLTVSLTAAATQTSVQTLLQSIGFRSKDKVAGNRTIQIKIKYIGGMNNTNDATRQIHVGP